MADGNSFINLGDLAKPATVHIEKVSNAVGILYEPRRIKKRAKAEVDADKIKAAGSIELTEMEQRGIERFVHQEARKQENIENITAEAAKELPQNAKTEELEEDWVAYFFNRCDKVSDKEMQSLWSSLLAGEATNPGSYSRRTIDCIASMDKKDAELFTKLGQFSWLIGEKTPLIFEPNDEIYTKNGVSFSTLKHLDTIGLVSFESISGYKRFDYGALTFISYFDQQLVVEFPTEHGNEIQLGKVLFTQAGKELVDICGSQKNDEFYQYAMEKLSMQKLVLKKIDQ